MPEPLRGKGRAPASGAAILRQMTSPELDPSEARLHVRGEDREYTLAPESLSADLDAHLAEKDAQTFVFLPLFSPKKKKRKRASDERRVEKRRKKLGEGEWYQGELETSDTDGALIPAAYTFDLRRYKARVIAESLGLQHFYWGCREGKIEVHQVEPFDKDEPFDLGSIRAVSKKGLRDLRRAAFDLPRLPESVAAVGGDMVRLGSVAMVVIGIALAFIVVAAFGHATPVIPEGESVSWTWTLLLLPLHPVILPTLAMGWYLRRHLLGGDETVRRELTRDEAGKAWNESAPHLLAVWIIILSGVLLLTFARLMAKDELSAVALVDKAATSGLIALWVITPLTYARDMPSAIGSSIEAAITVVVSVFVMKMTMFFAGVMTVSLLGVPYTLFETNLLAQLVVNDFITGLLKAAVFGLILAAIACHNGLKVTGGAAGVGRATTDTVVQTIVAVIVADLAFTGMFFFIGWTRGPSLLAGR